MRRKQWLWLGGSAMPIGVLVFASNILVETFERKYDADYVGSAECGTCHVLIYDTWKQSPHANMTRKPSADTVVGDFDEGSWTLPPAARKTEADETPAAHMFRRGNRYYMALRHPQAAQYVPFEIAYVIGYQYRQVYLTKETGGVLRRLPLQWSVPRQEFFPYWNLQEGSIPSVQDLWAQMGSTNSAWNLFCARCHVTNLKIHDKDTKHTRARTEWTDDGIACEACHGPGSLHIDYFKTNYANRLRGFLDSTFRGDHVAYMANASKLSRGTAMSVCARCHGTDILMGTTDVFRSYEPGFSREGRINDLSDYFKQTPLTPGRKTPTTEVWQNGKPKGIGMLFRAFIESKCYEGAEVRCYDCHDNHNNGEPRSAGRLEPSDASDGYCLNCHPGKNSEDHTRHTAGTSGARCYDCHMPKTISKITDGTFSFTRTHQMSDIPDPETTVRYGSNGAPNACNLCHTDRTPQWAQDHVKQWYGTSNEADE